MKKLRRVSFVALHDAGVYIVQSPNDPPFVGSGMRDFLEGDPDLIVTSLMCRVDGPSLLRLSVTHQPIDEQGDDAGEPFTEEWTYSGAFSIQWALEDEA